MGVKIVHDVLGEIVLITAHLDPKHAVSKYRETLDNIEALLEPGCTYVIGVDAQTPLGERLPEDNPYCIGDHAEHLERYLMLCYLILSYLILS